MLRALVCLCVGEAMFLVGLGLAWLPMAVMVAGLQLIAAALAMTVDKKGDGA